jgi:hypothetical protein
VKPSEIEIERLANTIDGVFALIELAAQVPDVRDFGGTLGCRRANPI